MSKRFILIAAIIIATIIVLAAAFASSYPDGLQRILGEKLGEGGFWPTALAGILGASIVFAVMLLIGKFVKKKDS